MTAPGSGHDALPEKQQRALRQEIRLEWLTIGLLVVSATLIYLVMGQSQAMQAALLDDLLSFLPPIAFLVAARVIRIGANRRFPFGQEIWAGWLMVAAMAATAVLPVILGRRKLTLAKTLHDKVLYADADMAKADWQTALATVVGASIDWDGWNNLTAAVQDLLDTRALTFDEEKHPLISEAEHLARGAAWVADAEARVRDQGHVLHVEMLVVPVFDIPAHLRDTGAHATAEGESP